jgi:hypothetical protein
MTTTKTTMMTITRTTTMTDLQNSHDHERLARKAVRARNLVDPLGARGLRRASERIEREAGARRLIFVASLASFTGLFGLLAYTAPDVPSQSPAPLTQPANVVAEIPVPSTDPNEPPTIVRVLAPDVRTEPDVRTSAS